MSRMLIDLAIAALLVCGGLFALIGSIGLARFPSLMTRLHGPTKATTLGVGSCLVASMIHSAAHRGVWTVHELLIVLFLFITAPVSANLIAKAHLHRRARRADPMQDDAVGERLPEPPPGTGWATFEPTDGAPAVDPPHQPS